ncbi:hypothetical protein [Leptolyngbya sp. BC1307]|uniref:hypothetical protein n=1 Tax=Leptolyngbya sp. BC1307 TaxID=2029589 RepID=UPI000EFBCA46|nr:hypothetical protein [Leptolyngbya sp. BC1307]
MTYTTQDDANNLSTAAVEPTPAANPSTVKKLKTLYQESSQRSQRVAKILRAAFTETAAEFKDGRAVISPLAKEVTAETVATVKEKSKQAADTVNNTWQQEADSKDMTERLIAFVRTMGRSAGQTARVELLPQLKVQAIKLDKVLSNRYGSRYATLKDRVAGIRQRYAATEPTQPETATDSPMAIEIDSEVVR